MQQFVKQILRSSSLPAQKHFYCFPVYEVSLFGFKMIWEDIVKQLKLSDKVLKLCIT